MPGIAYRLLVFFVLACAFTWFGHLGNWLWPSPWWPLPMNPLGPIVAAPLAIWLTAGRAGVSDWLRRIRRFRAPLWVWGVAIAWPLAVILASLGLAVLSGAATQPLPMREPLEFLILVPVMLLMGPGPEEPAFRGYGQVELETTMSPLAAAVWIGVGVVVWHLPVLLTGDVAWPFVVTLVAVSVIYAWLLKAGGSVWPLVALHFVVNYAGGEFLGAMLADAAGQTVYALYYAVFYVAAAGLIVWRFGPSLAGRRAATRAVLA